MNAASHPVHRRLLASAAALLLATALAACGSASSTGDATTTTPSGSDTTVAAEPLDQLRIHRPETLAFAAPFDLISDDGPLAAVANDITVEPWSTPDVLRSLLVNGESDVTAVPTYVGANLFNKDVDVHLAAVVVWGLLYVLGPDGTPADWSSLKGQTIMVPFQNDMPDLVFRYLAEANGLVADEDFTIEYYAAPPEAVARLITGTGTWAVLPEHVATLAIAKAGEQGHALTRVLDLQSSWADATGGGARIPQAGVVVSGEIAARHDVLSALLDELEADVAAVNSAAEATVAALAEANELPAPIVADVIPRLNLQVVPAADAKVDLERFFTQLSEADPEIIGGSLPDADFYLADPR